MDIAINSYESTRSRWLRNQYSYGRMGAQNGEKPAIDPPCLTHAKRLLYQTIDRGLVGAYGNLCHHCDCLHMVCMEPESEGINPPT